MELFQGGVKLFDKFDFQMTRTGNAYMHQQLRTYLEHYMECFKAINDFASDPILSRRACDRNRYLIF